MPAVGITDGPPPCACDHRAVVLLCPYLARKWAVLQHLSSWLVVNTQVKAYSRETHSLSRASKIYGHKTFQITHLHTTVINSGCATLLNTAYTVVCTVELASALTAATILADAAVTPTISEMTYNVSSGTLNHTQPTNPAAYHCTMTMDSYSHLHARLPSSIIWHRPKGGDILWLGR